MPHLEAFHLAPLDGMPDEDWKALASAALGAGFSAEKIARATLSLYSGASQREIAHWERFKDAFSALSASGTPDLQRVGSVGVEIAEKLIAEAHRKIREVEISGF